MAKVILVTGGARSGKSRFAEKLVREASEKRFYLATAPVTDAEMARRVERHRRDRATDNWQTIEEELDLPGAVRQAAEAGAGSILIDCLTLWIGNLLFHDAAFDEDKMLEKCAGLAVALDEFGGTAALVINEVGLGIVPDNALSRAFRDCSGRCSQYFGRKADEVYFVSCGLPLRIK